MTIKIVLARPSHQGNVGAAARAIKAMGFNKLTLVNPKAAPNEEAFARATHAQDLLENCIAPDLKTALAESELVIGTSARSRHINLPVLHPKELKQICSNKKNIAILFGNERTGLTNDELIYCNKLVHIPTDPNCSSLNLAAAIQIITYELSHISTETTKDFELASNAELQNFYDHLEETIHNIDFINATSSESLMLKLKALFQRAEPLATEIAILRGILTSIKRKIS